MRALLRRTFTPATILATLALLVALGGTSLADGAKRLITGHDVKDRSLTGRDIRDGFLTGRQIRDRSIGLADLAPGARRAGPAGPAGPAGERGPQGPRGPVTAETAYAGSTWLTRCGPSTTILSQKITVAEPSRIFAIGQYVYSANGTTTNGGSLRLSLQDEGGATVASLPLLQTYMDPAPLVKAGIMLPGALGGGTTPYVAPAGTDTMTMSGGMSSGACSGGGLPIAQSPAISHMLLPAG